MRNGKRQKIDIGYLVVAENFAEVDTTAIENRNIIRPKLVIKLGCCAFWLQSNLFNADSAALAIARQVQHANDPIFHKRTSRYPDSAFLEIDR